VKSLRQLNTKKTRKWLWISLAALAALQVYFVRELMAALFLFSVGFVIIAIAALVIYLFDRASQRTMDWAKPQTLRAARIARRALARAEEVRRKQLHRQRSETAQ
jgi:sensor histidine kinase regulating citrate/malate metabolism